MALLGPSWTTLAGAVAIAALAGALTGLFGGIQHQKGVVQREIAKQAQATLLAEREGARKAFRLQEAKDAESIRIDGWLADALRRLHDRPARVSRATPASCEGATGAELSGPDSEFLAGEAARADELRAALDQCQSWIEEVRKP